MLLIKFELKPGVKNWQPPSCQAPIWKKQQKSLLLYIWWYFLDNGADVLEIVVVIYRKHHMGKIYFFAFPVRVRPEPVDFQNFAPGPGPAHGPPVTGGLARSVANTALLGVSLTDVQFSLQARGTTDEFR